MVKQEKLKAFIVTWYVVIDDKPRSCAIIAHNKKEAGDIFVMWLKGKNMYERVTSVVCQTARRTRINSFMINNEYYEKQNAYVNKLFEKVNTK